MLLYSSVEFRRRNMGSARIENYDIIYNNQLPDKLNSELSKIEEKSTLQTISQDSGALLFPFYENNFLLETVDMTKLIASNSFKNNFPLTCILFFFFFRSIK